METLSTDCTKFLHNFVVSGIVSAAVDILMTRGGGEEIHLYRQQAEMSWKVTSF